MSRTRKAKGDARRGAMWLQCGVWPVLAAALLALRQAGPQPEAPLAGSSPPESGSSAAPAAAATGTSSSVPASPSAPPGSSASTGSSAAAASTAPASPINVLPWEYAPYSIHIWLAAEPSPGLDEAYLEQLSRKIATMAEVVVGAPWTVTVEAPPPELYYTVAICPELLTGETIAAARKEVLKQDKVMLASISASTREWRLRTREFDCHTRMWGPVSAVTERQPAQLPSTLFSAIVTAFAPLARIEDGQGKTCVVRSRATGLITDPGSPVAVVKGDVLQPIFRQNDRYGDPVPGKTEALPFTFLQVTDGDSQNPNLLNCNVHSGMRSPIHGRSTSTSRRERWAVKVRPTLSETVLFVDSKPYRRDEPQVALSGVEVFSKTPEPEAPRELTDEEKKTSEKSNPAQLLGLTDWRGSLAIPSSGPTLRVVYLKNGGLLLARLPIVAGLEPQVVAEIPDDNPRLQAEGFVRGMNSEVTDLVVQRQLIAVRMRKKITEGKLDEAEKLFEEFRDLKTLNDLQQMLNNQLQRQKPTTNPAVRQKIEKLYGDERELVTKYIDAELQVKLLAELAEARANPPPPPAAEETSTADPAAEGGSAADEKEKEKLPSALKSKGNAGS